MPPTNNSNRKPKTLLRLKSLLSTTTSTLSCGGCGSRRHKLPDVHQPLPKPSTFDPSSSATDDTDVDADAGFTSIPFSFDIHHADAGTYSSDPPPSRDSDPIPQLSTCSSRLAETLAVVKDSDDPYLDFKDSMLQVIFEKEIFAKRDLQELLACFLRLNSACHHDAIIRAFSEIWKTVVTENTPDSAAPANGEVRCSTKLPKEDG